MSQIKGLLLPPRKRWNNKYGWRWNQPYLLLAPDSNICAAPLSVSHTAAAEAGEASAQCIPAPIAWESPGKQLTGTQTANQMMDPTRRIRRDRGRWGSGVATTEPEDEGLMRSAASALCVCAFSYACLLVFACRYVSVCTRACIWMPMSVGGYFGTCSQVFFFFFLTFSLQSPSGCEAFC